MFGKKFNINPNIIVKKIIKKFSGIFKEYSMCFVG
jgi:hypothetical protein